MKRKNSTENSYVHSFCLEKLSEKWYNKMLNLAERGI